MLGPNLIRESEHLDTTTTCTEPSNHLLNEDLKEAQRESLVTSLGRTPWWMSSKWLRSTFQEFSTNAWPPTFRGVVAHVTWG